MIRRFRLADNSIREISFDRETLELIRSLPQLHSAYFNTEYGVEIAVEELLPIHIRTDGVFSAARLMKMALESRLEKRKPISIRKAQSDGFFRVEDGNSTLIVAKVAGWTSLWCHPLT